MSAFTDYSQYTMDELQEAHDETVYDISLCNQASDRKGAQSFIAVLEDIEYAMDKLEEGDSDS